MAEKTDANSTEKPLKNKIQQKRQKNKNEIVKQQENAVDKSQEVKILEEKVAEDKVEEEKQKQMNKVEEIKHEQKEKVTKKEQEARSPSKRAQELEVQVEEKQQVQEVQQEVDQQKHEVQVEKQQQKQEENDVVEQQKQKEKEKEKEEKQKQKTNSKIEKQEQKENWKQVDKNEEEIRKPLLNEVPKVVQKTVAQSDENKQQIVAYEQKQTFGGLLEKLQQQQQQNTTPAKAIATANFQMAQLRKEIEKLQIQCELLTQQQLQQQQQHPLNETENSENAHNKDVISESIYVKAIKDSAILSNIIDTNNENQVDNLVKHMKQMHHFFVNYTPKTKPNTMPIATKIVIKPTIIQQQQQQQEQEQQSTHVTDDMATTSAAALKENSAINITAPSASIAAETTTINFVLWSSESQIKPIIKLVESELSEPYSIYTFRYFIYKWPELCFLALADKQYVGTIICKLEYENGRNRGYIAMLAVDKNYRKLRIGTSLVEQALDTMIASDADEIVLETEVHNKAALALYENLGFIRYKRLFNYYLNGKDAMRLKLWLK